MSKVKILFFAADPLSAPPEGRADRLLLDEDIRQIREKVRASEHRDALEFDYRLAARQDDLLQALNEVRPDVVHFSGHGWREGLILVDPSGRHPQGVDVVLLTRLFRTFRGRIRVVVLNVCLSHAQARAIAAEVGCAIGMRGEISDQGAIAFGAAFYRAIGFGHSIQTAFDQGCLALSSSERDCPQLVARSDTDPAEVKLVSPDGEPPRAPVWTKRAAIASVVAAAGLAGGVYLALSRSQESVLAPTTTSPADSQAAQAVPPPAAQAPIHDSDPRQAAAVGGSTTAVQNSGVAPPDSSYRPPPVDESENAVRNGGFQNRFAEWIRTVDGGSGKGTNEIVSFADARSGYALHLTYQGKGSLLFSQKVSVPGPDYVFRGTFRASSHEGGMIGFSGTGIATVMLQYLDKDARVLGITSFYSYVENPLANTPLVGVPRRGNGGNDVHYIDVEKGRLYQDMELDVRREIEENLIGVAVEQVRTVAIVLYCGANDAGAGAELWVSDLSLRPKR